jgi:hypothetical protein
MSLLADQFAIDEKNAIIALQAILSTRGAVSEEKYHHFAYYLGRLPPYRALLVYGQVMHAIANRMEEEDPQKFELKRLATTITETIRPDFPQMVEKDPEYFESQRLVLADNLNKIARFMHHFQEKQRPVAEDEAA